MSAPMPAEPPPVTRTITLAEGMTVKDLADKLDLRVKDVLAKLLMKRLMLTINSTLDTDTATMIAREFGAEVQMRSFEQELIQEDADEARAEDVVTRAPVVTVMGHVDHGKTSLLDAIRTTRVAEREAGGITQHIGAYHVTINGRNIVFLDTPGHEAFTLMRARGAKVTDLVVLVVAADDGVMPQTKEAIDHAKAAGVPIVVAINKIDKPNANTEKVKRELTELDLMPEEWGGKTVTVDVSAKKKQNLDLLLEMILLVTDIGELKANPKRNASGTVLEAKLDKGRGPVATVLVQDGTLRVGETFIAGPIVGRVRALIDDRGKPVKSAGPSTPVEVLGLAGLPQPGDLFQVADAAKARQIATFREDQAKARSLGAKGGRLTLESLQAHIAEGGMKELPVIVKADVQGSAEVLSDTLTKLTDEKVKIRIIHSGVGAVNESDVLLASASNAIIIAFNVRPDRNAEEIATRERVEIRQHSVIYNVTDEMKKAMTGLLDPTFKEVRLGVAEVRNTFKVPKFGTIAGCMVTEGRITRAGDTQARLLRDNVVVYEGKIGSLRRFKDDVSEVKTGFECGIGFDKFNDLKVGDLIEVFAMERVLVRLNVAHRNEELRMGIRSDPVPDSEFLIPMSQVTPDPDRPSRRPAARRAGAAAQPRGARSGHRLRDAHARAAERRPAIGSRLLHLARRRGRPEEHGARARAGGPVPAPADRIAAPPEAGARAHVRLRRFDCRPGPHRATAERDQCPQARARRVTRSPLCRSSTRSAPAGVSSSPPMRGRTATRSARSWRWRSRCARSARRSAS